MLPGDYIVYKFTGEINTTKNGLSEGILWNYESNTVANELLSYYGIDKDLTPTIVDNFINQGTVTKKASEESGFVITSYSIHYTKLYEATSIVLSSTGRFIASPFFSSTNSLLNQGFCFSASKKFLREASNISSTTSTPITPPF